MWIARMACPWRNLPEGFGKWNSVFKRFRRWAKADTFNRVFRALAEDIRMSARHIITKRHLP